MNREWIGWAVLGLMFIVWVVRDATRRAGYKTGRLPVIIDGQEVAAPLVELEPVVDTGKALISTTGEIRIRDHEQYAVSELSRFVEESGRSSKYVVTCVVEVLCARVAVSLRGHDPEVVAWFDVLPEDDEASIGFKVREVETRLREKWMQVLKDSATNPIGKKKRKGKKN